MPEPRDPHDVARDFIAALALDAGTAARMQTDAARRQRPTIREQIARHFRDDPEARALYERVKSERDAELAARKASRRLPTPPRKRLPASGRRKPR